MALILVLIVVGAALALGTALLTMGNTRILASGDLHDYTIAESLAESGLSEAEFFLQYPDSSQPDGFWPGVSQRQLDSSANYYEVVVAQDVGNESVFQVVSTAHVFAGEEEVLSLSMERSIRRPDWGKFTMDLMATQDLNIPSQIILTGDAYATGNITNRGTINGNVEATESINNLGTVTGEINPDCRARYVPACDLSNPVTYRYGGVQYQATTISSKNLQNVNWSTPPPNNPMSVYVRKGDLVLKNNVTIIGTVIVTGKLSVSTTTGENTITANPGFPALVVEKNIVLKGKNSGMTLGGALIAKKLIKTNKAGNSTVVVNGPVAILGKNAKFDVSLSGITFSINHAELRMDVSGLFP